MAGHQLGTVVLSVSCQWVEGQWHGHQLVSPVADVALRVESDVEEEQRCALVMLAAMWHWVKDWLWRGMGLQKLKLQQEWMLEAH